MLLKRYSNIEYILNMELMDFMEILRKAILKEKEEKIWQRWLVERPLMQEFISFSDYLNKFTSKKENKRLNIKFNIKEILEEAEKIKAADQKGDK